MHDLNKQQVVLLSILVAFVTSIATGITVVSLMDQSPDPVTQTINRVVERTIERVVEEPAKGGKEVERIVETVIVNQEDLTVEAVSKNSQSLVRIYEKTATERVFKGLGIIVSDSGQILTDASVASLGGKIVIDMDGQELELSEIKKAGGFVLFKVPENSEIKFVPVVLADSKNIQLAQTVILLSGSSQNIVSTGIINNVDKNAEDINQEFITSVDKVSILTGSILLNLQGDVIGIRANGSLTTPSSFTPSNVAKNFLKSE